MKTLYALAFVCMSLQAHAFDLGASACDFDALNAATTVDSYEYTAAASLAAIPSEDEPMDATIEYSLLGTEWISETTGSISEADRDERLRRDQFFAY
jgi:hypothetical protein